jgi:hypothetical protein
MPKIRIFASFDVEHDRDLYEQLLEQSLEPASGFEIAGRSRAASRTDHYDDELRAELRRVDEVVFLCGEHTDGSPRVTTELGIAQQEDRPYFLIWGRREIMCTRPTGSKPADSMYSWTPSILRDQLVTTLRRNAPAEALVSAARAEGGRKR